jgi:putative NADH-flavin reductase
MEILVVGASGATGKHVVEQLLEKGHKVKIIVRSLNNLPENWIYNCYLRITIASILELSREEINMLVKDCDAVVSCLGHNLSFKGIYGQPRMLVKDAVTKICNAIIENEPFKPVKFLLMNTSGNSNRDLNEPISFAQKCVISILRLLLPPHVDNEKAADYLRVKIGKNNKFINWVAVRPDGLINQDVVTKYEVFPSPTRSAIFNAGKISRINVANFMVNLIHNDFLWCKWKGQMPVIYNKDS